MPHSNDVSLKLAATGMRLTTAARRAGWSRAVRARLAAITLLLAPLSSWGQPAPAPAEVAPATAAPAEAAPVEAPAQVGVREASIDAWLPPDQLLWLEADTERFPARYRAALTATPRGAVLILHDAGQHPSWPTTLAALFEELPRHGWHTLAIALPAPTTTMTAGGTDGTAAPAAPGPLTGSGEPATASPATAPGAEPSPAPAEPQATPPPTATLEPEAQANARMAAALSHLQREAKESSVVLAGFGDGALRALRLTAGQDVPIEAAALVMVDFPTLDAMAAATSRQQLAAVELPILDIQQGNSAQATEQAELRELVAQKKPQRLYTRLQLPTLAAPSRDAVTPLIRRIRGWLQRNLIPAEER